MHRKQFLRLSLYGVISTLIPFQDIRALSLISKKNSYSSEDYQTAEELAAQAKVAFFKKEYALAESLYLQCISLVPSQIQYYDGLQNAYAVLEKNLQVVQLFKNGIDANPSKVVFYDRLATTLVRVELGNRALLPQVHELFGGTALLDEAISLYNQAINIDSTKNYLKKGLDRIVYLKAINTNTIYAHDNAALKANKKTNKQKYLSRFDGFTNEELLGIINDMDSKKRHELFDSVDIGKRTRSLIKEKKAILKTLVDRHYTNKDYSSTIDYTKAMYNLDKSDPKSMKLLSMLYGKIEDYDSLVMLKRDWHTTKNDAWSKLGLIHALDIAFNKTGNNVYLDEAVALATNLFIESLGFQDKNLSFKIGLKTAKIYRENHQNAEAITIYKNYLESNDLSSSQKQNAAIGYIKTIRKSGDHFKAKRLLKLALKQDDKVSDLEEVLIYNSTKDIKKEARSMFEYELYKHYEDEADDNNRHKTIDRILLNNPNDEFVKRISKEQH